MMSIDAILRDAGAERARRAHGPSRLTLLAKVRRELELPAYLADFRLVPGQCRKRRCKSRYGVIRLSLDFTSRERVDRFATVECAACGHTWRRCREPRLAEYQTTRLTLILPSSQRRWYARGRWHVQGTDAIVLRDATQLDLMAAFDDWRVRNGQYLDSRARAKAKREAADLEARERAAVTMAKLAELDAERERQEQEAEARDAA